MNLSFYWMALAGIGLSATSCQRKPPNAPSSSTVTESNYTLQPTSYDSLLSLDTYPVVSPPRKSPTIRWDFSGGFKQTYSFNQQNQTKTDLGVSQGTSQQHMNANGLMKISSNQDQTAKVSVTDIEISLLMDPEDKSTEFTQTVPPVVIMALPEDSSLSWENSQRYGKLDHLFPIPSTSLSVGESSTVPIETRFNAMGTSLRVTGTSTITLVQFVQTEHCQCAQLLLQNQIDQLEVPEELEGEYSFWSQEHGIFYFDPKTRSFTEGTMISLMAFSIDVPIPQIVMEGEPIPQPQNSKMSMHTQGVIQYNIK